MAKVDKREKWETTEQTEKNGKLIIIIIIMIMTKIVATYIVAVDWLNGDQLKPRPLLPKLSL